MLKMKKGCTVPFPEKLFESYQIEENRITANVGADKIEEVIKNFIVMHNEPQFFILELPTNDNDEEKTEDGSIETAHKDVYYIDGCSQAHTLEILNRVGDLLINDGLCCFGFGCHESGDEIMFYQYNVMNIFSQNIDKYESFMKQHDVPKVENVVTAWDTFSYEHPGMTGSYKSNGLLIYDLPEYFKDWGIYFAERREEY